ncbi:oxidase [Saccharata proteae CBS 121410]|uniref:Oxidase n=1 Tax=Saccharata proteae CBS 121410 TaxID=1314787 RepID=A0A9P4HYJ1_9PEZI|nr:oxidase [Saccharata proteae CBS 121410]
MKWFTSSLLLLQLGGGLVNAFPAAFLEKAGSASKEDIRKQLDALKGDVAKHTEAKRLLFDALSTPLDITGDHAFVAPDIEGGDQRGPCPGLNALANHGYIPHNGVTSFTEVIAAANGVYNMGIDLVTILALMGTVWVGNPLSLNPGFSIGGPTAGTDNILDNLGGLLGDPRGLQGSHNWIESDSSLTRNDLYQTGDAWTMNMTLFKDFYDRSDDVITFDDFTAQADRRFQYSKANNPNFYYGPVTGFIARNAGYMFGTRLLSNHTSEAPLGVMHKDTFRSFWAVYGDDEDSYEYKFGHEQIPENWYKRATPYGLVELNLDLAAWMMKYPELASVGGNTGTVNSFTGVDLGNVTGGLLNAETLLEGNNLLCFVFEVIKTFAPEAISPLFATIEEPVQWIVNTLDVPIANLSCPAYGDLEAGGKPLWDVLQDKYPGAKAANSSL